MFTTLKIKETFRPTDVNQWEANKAAKQIIVGGKLLDRFDKEDDKGCHSGFFVEYDGFEYTIRMTNGDVKSVRKLWEV